MIGQRFEAQKTGLNLSAEASSRHMCRASSRYPHSRKKLPRILALDKMKDVLDKEQDKTRV